MLSFYVDWFPSDGSVLATLSYNGCVPEEMPATIHYFMRRPPLSPYYTSHNLEES
jgi:hypothetical protein